MNVNAFGDVEQTTHANGNVTRCKHGAAYSRRLRVIKTNVADVSALWLSLLTGGVPAAACLLFKQLRA